MTCNRNETDEHTSGLVLQVHDSFAHDEQISLKVAAQLRICSSLIQFSCTVVWRFVGPLISSLVKTRGDVSCVLVSNFFLCRWKGFT